MPILYMKGKASDAGRGVGASLAVPVCYLLKTCSIPRDALVLVAEVSCVISVVNRAEGEAPVSNAPLEAKGCPDTTTLNLLPYDGT